MAAQPHHSDDRAVRDHLEKLILAFQLSGSVLDRAVDRALFADPLHRAVQETIDRLGPRDLDAIEHHFAPPLAHRAIDIHAWLRELPAVPRAAGDEQRFDDDFASLITGLRRLERDRAGEAALCAASAIGSEAIAWLWDGWLARGKLHLLAGSVGAGKTTLALSLAATLTSAGQFPDGTRARGADVLFWSGEDDTRDSLVPRFLACGGDPDRLIFVQGVRDRRGGITPFDPARDLAALARATGDHPHLALLVVDPIVSAVAGDTDRNAATRRSLSALVDLAVARNIAVLGITHFGKTRRGRNPLLRVLGSNTFIAMARLIMCTAKGADGSPLLVRAKSNIGPDGDGFAYALAREEISPGIVGQKIAWAHAVTGAAGDLICDAGQEPAPPAPRLIAARDWLAARLGNDGARVEDLKPAAAHAGHSWITILRARQSLGVTSTSLGPNGSLWKLPPQTEQ